MLSGALLLVAATVVLEGHRAAMVAALVVAGLVTGFGLAWLSTRSRFAASATERIVDRHDQGPAAIRRVQATRPDLWQVVLEDRPGPVLAHPGVVERMDVPAVCLSLALGGSVVGTGRKAGQHPLHDGQSAETGQT